MRVVLDTNVLISGIFFTGPPYRILQSWKRGKLSLLISEPILIEYFRVSSFLSAQYPDVNLDPILSLLVAKAKLIQATELPTPICSDPDDDKFIACAVSGKSKFMISGDKELLKVSGYRGIQILSPRAFLDHYL